MAASAPGGSAGGGLHVMTRADSRGGRVVVVEGLALSDAEATVLSLVGVAAVLALVVAVSIASTRRGARFVNGIHVRLAECLGGEFVPSQGIGYGHVRLVRSGLSVEVSNETDWRDDERLLNDRTKIIVRSPGGRSWSQPSLIITRSPGRHAPLDDPAVFAHVVRSDPRLLATAARVALLELTRVAYEVEIRPTEFVAWFTPGGPRGGRRYVSDVDTLVRLVDLTVAAAAALLP
jgi:hypothetical protein